MQKAFHQSTDPIEYLSLSVRSTNALKRSGVLTIGQLSEQTRESLESIRNLGKKSIEEILHAKDSIFPQNPDESKEPDASSPKEITFLYHDGSQRKDIDIEHLGLSVRAVHCLHNAGFQYASQLLGISTQELLQIKSMGKKTADEIVQTAHTLDFLPAEEESQTDEAEARIIVFCQEIYACFDIPPQNMRLDLKQIQETGATLSGESLYYYAYQLPYLQTALQKKVYDLLYEAVFDPVSRSALDRRLPQHLFNTTITDEALVALENDGRIIETDDGYVCRYPTCMEYAATVKSDNKRFALTERLKGRTLDDIGNEMGNTRERVRQLVENALNHRSRPRLYEDRYVYLFDTYYFRKEDFCAAFHEPPETFEYLALTVKKKADAKLDLELALSDPNLSEKQKRRLHRIVYRNYIFLDGQPVKIDRQTLVVHAIRRFAQAQISYADFTQKYLAWLDDLGLGDRENLKYNTRTYENKVSSLNCVLWNFNTSFRYYDITAINAADFFEAIPFAQYADLAITTRLLFCTYPDVMQEYDIRDEYELHNLLRKLDVVHAFSDLRITLPKMPSVILGSGNAETQALDLLIELAPVSADDLAAKYEERFGLRKDTVTGNLFRWLSDYYYQGTFTIDAEGLLPEESLKLQERMTDDFYLKKDIMQLYLRLYPNGNTMRINPYSLKTLGFHVYDSYVVSKKYRSAADYFDHLLAGHPITDMTDAASAYAGITLYSSELSKLKAERRIIEFAPKQYITMERLNECGIFLADIEQYCDAVADFVDPGEYFTVKSLRGRGFSSPLDDFGFDDWFYMSLLCENRTRFSYQRVANSKLFCRSTRTVSLPDFFLSIMLHEEQMDYYDFLELLAQNYGLEMDPYKVKAIIRDSGMYYDDIMEKVYIDYDTYYEEV